jgi:hypothetical protein
MAEVGVKTVSTIQNVRFIFMVGGVVVFIFPGLPRIQGVNIAAGSSSGLAGVWKGGSLWNFPFWSTTTP